MAIFFREHDDNGYPPANKSKLWNTDIIFLATTAYIVSEDHNMG